MDDAYDTCAFVHVMFVGCTNVYCVSMCWRVCCVYVCMVYKVCVCDVSPILAIVSTYVDPCFLISKLILMSIYVAESINNN